MSGKIIYFDLDTIICSRAVKVLMLESESLVTTATPTIDVDVSSPGRSEEIGEPDGQKLTADSKQRSGSHDNSLVVAGSGFDLSYPPSGSSHQNGNVSSPANAPFVFACLGAQYLSTEGESRFQ